MSVDAYFTRPLKQPINVPKDKPPILIASLGPLRAGAYVAFAKVIVVTRVDETGQDSALAEFSLEAGTSADKALCSLWHSSDQGSLQPADTVSLQLPVKLTPLHTRSSKGRFVRLYCNSRRGILELRDLVITAIRLDTIADLTAT